MTDRAARLQAAIAALETEFGREWLQWNSGLMPRRGQKSPTENHPIARAWAEARQYLTSIGGGGGDVVSEVPPAVAFVMELAADVELTRGIPNFKSCVESRLKGKDFEKAQYEMHVGAMYRKAGRQVEFVPRAKGRRTADLKVTHEGRGLFVECTRKDAYEPAGVDDKRIREGLQKDLLALQRELGVSREVAAIVVGSLNPEGASEILAEARRVVTSGTNGIRMNATGSIGLAVKEPTSVPLPPGSLGGVVIPASILSPNREKGLAMSEGTFTPDAEGRLSITGVKSAAVYVIDSHKMTSVVDSLRAKFGQIAKGDCGLVYVNLDVSNVALGDFGFYARMVRQAVERAMTTPPVLTQLGAVVMTTGLLALPGTNAEGQPVTAQVRVSIVVPNPAGSLPPGFMVPDPWLFEERE